MPSNLPPGVTDDMIPGNRPKDVAFETFCDELSKMLDKAQIKCVGDQFDVLACAIFEYIDNTR